jgi:hypothetical protein
MGNNTGTHRSIHDASNICDASFGEEVRSRAILGAVVHFGPSFSCRISMDLTYIYNHRESIIIVEDKGFSPFQ